MTITTIFFTVLCCSIFTAQLVAYIMDVLNSTELYTEMRKVHLSDQPLPLTISICLKPGLNQTQLRSAGYSDEMFYTFGKSRYNTTHFGWGGHTEDGKFMYENISVLRAKLPIWKDLSDVVSYFVVRKNTSYEKITDKMEINSMVASARQFYAKYCFTLKPKAVLKADPLNIFLQPNLPFYEIEVKLSDINLYSGRQIVAHAMNHQGDRIATTNLQTQRIKLYYVELSQEVYVEEDPTKNCTNYPNSEHETYNDCDRHAALSELSKEISPSFFPLWASDSYNFSRVTTEPVFIDGQNGGGYLTHINYLAGITTTHCRLPCKITKTVTKFITDQKHAEGSGISVAFNQKMQVTETSLVQFSPIKCLCDMGGMLGLWLGLGALQLSELLVRTAQVVGRKLAVARSSSVAENN